MQERDVLEKNLKLSTCNFLMVGSLLEASTVTFAAANCALAAVVSLLIPVRCSDI